jgi:hypothetical protein
MPARILQHILEILQEHSHRLGDPLQALPQAHHLNHRKRRLGRGIGPAQKILQAGLPIAVIPVVIPISEEAAGFHYRTAGVCFLEVNQVGRQHAVRFAGHRPQAHNLDFVFVVPHRGRRPLDYLAYFNERRPPPIRVVGRRTFFLFRRAEKEERVMAAALAAENSLEGKRPHPGQQLQEKHIPLDSSRIQPIDQHALNPEAPFPEHASSLNGIGPIEPGRQMRPPPFGGGLYSRKRDGESIAVGNSINDHTG